MAPPYPRILLSSTGHSQPPPNIYEQPATASEDRAEYATYAPRMRTVSLPPVSNTEDFQHQLIPHLPTPPPSPENRRIQRSHTAPSEISHRSPLVEFPRVDMNSLLSGPTPSVMFDVREDPKTSLVVSGVTKLRCPYLLSQPAVSSLASHITIVSPYFIWAIEVFNSTESAVTWSDVFDGIYLSLKTPIRDSEWGLASETRKESMDRAKRRRRRLPFQDIMRRVDWLGDEILFIGLTKDEEYISNRFLPGQDSTAHGDIWVAKFISSERHS